MKSPQQHKLAVWAITPNGARLADRLADSLKEVTVYISQNLTHTRSSHVLFERLSVTLAEKFRQYTGHIFIMSTGIVVRVLAPLVQNKIKDPAVVVVDDLGKHAISLLSGHIGGANELARDIAHIVEAEPVITTATDINALPAIDVIAVENGLVIENPGAIKSVNMALLNKKRITVHDPANLLGEILDSEKYEALFNRMHDFQEFLQQFEIHNNSCVYIDDRIVELPSHVLILRPPSLVAGIGCNRGTDRREIGKLLGQVLKTNRLSLSSLTCLASIDVKNDEAGLIETSRQLELPLVFFKREELNQVRGIQNPSQIVEHHVGVRSVCEAAAILASRSGTLIVPKNSTKNVTVAIARTASLSLE
ncbi:MAG: cobalt-precorrin 5A hydrolase [Deltaproteobacteria bacterium]|jgi:cobalt-precorrin 5A hydrolase|nr:cobalt-precorrin 5A hydrolase [Deltaproteobacteria bacterium]MBW2482010.1 cobalt-precorrin 5A hydrolase [Deltaproteobacteria bacterium]